MFEASSCYIDTPSTCSQECLYVLSHEDGEIIVSVVKHRMSSDSCNIVHIAH